MRLPRAQTRDVVCERDLRVAMDDGAVLLADRGCARDSEDGRSRRCWCAHPTAGATARRPDLRPAAAERGLQVVIQSVRGTFGSEGGVQPVRRARRRPGDAALAARAALARGRIGMIGPSYLGLVQWAVAPEAGDDLAALAIQVSASQFHGQTYAGGSLSLETAASWLVLVAAQERRLAPLAMVARDSAACPACSRELPLGELDAARDRRGGRVVSRGAGKPGARGRLLGRARLRRRRREGRRARPAGRRLARHLPAVDARGLRRAAGGRPRAAARDRPVDAHGPGLAGGGPQGRARVAARAPARRRPAARPRGRCGSM